MHNFYITPLFIATWQTFYMVFISSFVSIFVGLACGVLLFITHHPHICEQKGFYRVFDAIINIGRSIPFIILLISIIPITRWLVGTAIGINAAVVPLTIAAIPFFARVAESALAEVSEGLIETANALGATTWQTVYKVLIPEALPSLIKGATLTIIALIGYSAMAGVVGGGGLGELAINYGYQRFNITVMLGTVVILVVIVQLVQMLGDKLALRPRLKWLIIPCMLLWAVCIGSQIWPASVKGEVLKIGIVAGPQEKVMQVAQEVAQARYGMHLKFVVFDDYQLPNEALDNGDIDANIFQHVPFLNAQIRTHGYALVPIAKTFVYPFGFYSRKVQDLSSLKDGAIVAIPNDPSNEGRALLLLQKAKFIALKKRVTLFGTPRDIIHNPKNLQFKVLDAAALPRMFQDVDLIGLTNDYAKTASFSPQQALLKEGPDSLYANVLVVRTKDQHRPIFKKLITILHSQPVLKATMQLFPAGGAIPAWR